MKKIVLAIALLAAAGTFTATTSQAQVSVSFNIGRQPLWGPTGYDYAGYYYMPDIDCYYDVSAGQYIYMDGGQWVFRSQLPYQYRNYDLYHGYKVVVNENRPWMRNDYYRRQYRGYRGRRGQAFIRDSRDNRYYENPNHPYHNQWRGGGGVIREGDRANYRDDRRGDRRDDRRFDDRRGDDRRGDGRRGEDHGDRGRGDRGGDRGRNGGVRMEDQRGGTTPTPAPANNGGQQNGGERHGGNGGERNGGNDGLRHGNR